MNLDAALPQPSSARMKAIAAFLFNNPETYVLFPSSALRDEYVRLCTERTGACAAGSYIKFGALQEILCRFAHGGALRILTHAERINTACEFLFEKGVRETVLKLERCATAPAADFAYSYATKLLRIFSHYPRIRTLKESGGAQKREAFKNVFGLLQRYEEFLRGRGCIDSAAAMFLMYEEPAVYASMPLLRIAPFAPGLFSKTARLFLRGAQGLPAFTCLHDAPNTPREKSSEKFSADFFFKNDTPARAAWPASDEEALALLAPKKFGGETPNKTVLRFANAAQELNAVFARIAGLIKNGVLPRNIACSIADMNPSMRAEIGSLSTKYDVPAALISGRRESPILQSFLQSIEACLETNMHPEALRETLMIAGVPWKNRRAIIELVSVGMRKACVDGERLERWRRALSQADKRAGFETDEPRERAAAEEFHEEPDAENPAEHSDEALNEISDQDQAAEIFFEEQEPVAPRAPEVPEQPISLKKFFFSLRKAFMELRGARTYAQLHRAFSYLRRAFMRMPAPKNENTVMPRIAEIIRELFVHERARAARSMRASPWRVLCSVALTRSGEHFLDANAVGVYALEDSVGIWREHHFFVHLAHNSITKSSEDQPVFGAFADARLFDAPDPTEHAARETLFRAAVARGGEHVYVSASDEDYGGDMRLAPHDVADAHDTQAALSEDVFEIEQALWAASPAQRNYSGYYFTPAQRRGLASREFTLTRRGSSFLIGSLSGGTLAQAAPTIRRYAEAQGIRGRDAALLMADPAHFLLQEIFGAQNLFESLDEKLHDTLDFGTLFHDIAREALARTVAMRAVISEDAAREIIETQMQKSRAHVMVRPSLKSLFSREAAARMVQCLCAFAWEKAGEHEERIEPEKTLAGNLAALCGGAFDTALSGRADLVIAAALETNEAPAEQCSARAFFIVDYKKKAREVQDFPQAWLYSLMLGSDNAEDTNGAKKLARGAAENQQAGIALFDIGKNLLDFEKKHDARLDFITPENKKIPEVVACYKDLLRESFAGLCEARFTPLADPALAAVRAALREVVLQAPHLAESRALIWRDGCYAYPNKVFAPAHASS